MLKGESEKRVWKKFVVKCKSPPAAAARMVFTNTWHQNYYKIALASEILNIFHGQVGDTDEKGRRLILSTLVHHHHHHRHQQQHNQHCSPYFIIIIIITVIIIIISSINNNIISNAHPGSIVLSFPPVVWPTNHHGVRLHTTKTRCLAM